MAFPATYNISLYRGDTYDFVVNPKNPNGTSFNLTGYSARFIIATERNNPEAFIGNGTATVNVSAGTITCVIPAAFSRSTLTAPIYVYDLEIFNSSAAKQYTLLTGNLSVASDVVEGS